MNSKNEGAASSQDDLESALAGLTSPAPADFGLRVLQHVGIPQERYDTYVRLDTDAGGLYVACSSQAITGAMMESMVVSPAMFEELHWRRTGRTAIRSTVPFPGVRTALRTGRTRKLPIDLAGLSPNDCAVLEAVRSIPEGQLRPLTWLAREADLDCNTKRMEAALARNPMTLIIPCHRVTYDNGTPCDAAYLPQVGRLLRDAEGIDIARLEELTRRGAVFLGSDTTYIYCHPTCAHARRITQRHQRSFRSSQEAHQAGYRACRSCRPATL